MNTKLYKRTKLEILCNPASIIRARIRHATRANDIEKVKSLNLKLHEVLVKLNAEVIEHLEQKISTPEVLVADPEKQYADTVDLILIDDKGRIRLFDFKNNEEEYEKCKNCGKYTIECTCSIL